MSESSPGGAWDDLFGALEFVVKRFEVWKEEQRVHKEQAELIASHYQRIEDLWRQARERGEEPPPIAELPQGLAKAAVPVRVYCYWRFLRTEIQKHQDAGRLTLPQYHSLTLEAKERLAALTQRLQEKGLAIPRRKGEKPAETETIPLQETVRPSVAPEKAAPAPARRSLLEILLDPRSIHWLLGSGGALFVIGIVILLWANDYLTPPVMAVTMGVSNIAVLLAGWGVMLKTRYHFTGKAITLLACFIMPLNLWYYHANGLVTVADHLWVAALFISGFYAVSAYVLKDELFVYILMGGVTMTGLLMLASIEPSPEYFWEIASPSSFLVVLGVLALHLERTFPPTDGPFSRKKFGMAFFWSGQALLAAGLLLLLSAQAAGDWLWKPIFEEIYNRWEVKQSPIVTNTELRLLALALVLAGTYAYLYSDLVVSKAGFYLYLAAGTFFWALVSVVRILDLPIGINAFIAALAVLALVINLLQATLTRNVHVTRSFPIFGAILSGLAVLLGLHVYQSAVLPTWSVAEFDHPWWTVTAMLFTAISCRVGAYLYRESRPKLSWYYFFATAAATLVGAVALLTVPELGLTQWHQAAPILMLIPIAYIITARFHRGQASEQPVLWCAHVAAIVMILSSLATTALSLKNFFRPTQVQEELRLNLILSLFFAEAMVFYGLSAFFFKHRADIHLATAMACAAVWQLLTYAQMPEEYYTLVFALVGMGLLLIYRSAVLEKMAKTAFQSGNTLMTISLVAAVFIALSRIATRQVHWEFIGLCVTLGLLSLVAVALVHHSGWQRWYVVSAIAQALLTFLAINVLRELSPWQKLEIFCVTTGLVLLICGHWGWYREQERQSDLVSLALFLGSLLSAVPLAIAAIVDRSRGTYDGILPWLNELGFLCVSVLLLITGFLFRLKATTLIGAFHTGLYFLTLMILLPWDRINAVAIYITVGGALLFVVGLALSIYREWLLTLPERFQKREGIFEVLNWR